MWAVHNSVKGWTLYNLAQKEVQLLIKTLTSNEVRMTFVAQKNTLWVKLDQKIHEELFNYESRSPEGFEKFEEKQDQEQDTDFFIFKPVRRHLDRVHERKEFEVSIVLEGQSQQFKSTTIDLSEGGIYLKDVIPDWISGYFVVRIIDQKEILQLICCLVEDQKIRQRIQVVSEENDQHFLKYKSWLSTK